MEDKKPAEIEGYLFAAVAAGGRFLSFYFQPCLLPSSCSLSLLVSVFLYSSLVFVLLVRCGAFLLLCLFLSSLPLTASRSCSLCLSVALSDGINYLSYEAPYLSLVASVDLLS